MAGPVLEILSGDLAGRSYEVDGDTFTIGRKDDCDIVLPKKYVSRVHAELVREGERFIVRGVSEKNPIRVDGREVGEHGLQDGDEFELCGIRFKFRAKGNGGRASEKRGGPRKPVRFDSDVGDARDDARDASAGDEETAPPPSQHDDLPRDDDEGPRERVVFGEDSEGPKHSASSPSAGSMDRPASGSGAGSGDEANKQSDERTDAIDVLKLREKKKADDPFADDDAEAAPSVDPAAHAARERFLRALVIAGILGIVFAGAFLARNLMVTPPPKTFEKELSVAVDETRIVDEPWSMEDPPLGTRPTDPSGEPYLWYENDTFRVEWAVPDLNRTALFLVTGKRKGESAFQMPLQSKNRVLFHVNVRGDSQHEIARAERKKELAAKTIPDLKALVRTRLDAGLSLRDARETPGKEDYYRRSLHELERATEAVKELSEAIDRAGQPDPDLEKLRSDVDRATSDARADYEKYLHRHRSQYVQMVKHEQKREAKAELAILLRVIDDPCDLEFIRLNLILEKVWQGRLTDRITCIERAP